MRNYKPAHQLLRLTALLILPVTYGLILLFKRNASIVDSLYCSRFYPAVSRITSGIFGKLPFSVFEYAAYALIALTAVILVIRVLRLIFLRKEAFMRLVSFIITIAITASYLVFFFYLLWGFNFYRTPIDKTLNLPKGEYGSTQLYALCQKLSADAARLRVGLTEDNYGVFIAEDAKTVFDSVSNAFNEYGKTHELYKNSAPPIKAFSYSKLLSKLRILGFYICYTAEPNVNTEQPALYLGFSAAHETAHYLGWAKEDEASFIAYLVCSRSGDNAAAYSVTMHALTNCAHELRKLDPELYEALVSGYSEAMIKDIRSYSEYAAKYKDSKAGDAADHANDAYLTFNGQEDGVNSYENDVDLLLRYYDEAGLFIGL